MYRTPVDLDSKLTMNDSAEKDTSEDHDEECHRQSSNLLFNMYGC